MDESLAAVPVDYAALADEEFARHVRAFDPYGPALQQDPVPFERELQQRCPVAHADAYGGFWMVSRYQDVFDIMQNTTDFSNEEILRPHKEFPFGRQIPLETDAPMHAKYRQGIAEPFRANNIARIEPLIRRTARRLIRQIQAKGEADFDTDFAIPLPAEAFLHTFEIPAADLGQFLALKQQLVENRIQGTFDTDKYEIAKYFQARIDERRDAGATGPDVISHMLRARIDGRPWTDAEMINSCMNLMLGSLDTTTSFLTLIFENLAHDPQQRHELAQDPTLIPIAIEELLRVEPITTTGRLVVNDVDFHGNTFRKGDFVMFMMRAANRDPQVYDQPDTTDLRRAPKHLTFGAGPHRCLGMHQARATIRIALEEWLEVFPDFDIVPGSNPRRRLTMVRATSGLRLAVGR